MPYPRTSWVEDSTPAIDAANLNNIEDGISKAAYAPDASSGFVPVGDGSGAWVYKKITNAEISATAAIARSKLDFGSGLVNADIAAAAAIAYAKLALTGSIVNADVASAAAIALSKLAGYPSDGTKFAAGDGTWKAPGGTTYRKTTSKQVVSTITETDLLNGEITLAAAVLGSTGVARITAWGDHLNNTGASKDTARIKLKLAGTTLVDTSILTSAWGTNASRGSWFLEARIMNTSSSSQVVGFNLAMQHVSTTAGASFFTTGNGIVTQTSDLLVATGNGSGSIDTTSAAVLALTATLATSSASLDITLRGALVEIV